METEEDVLLTFLHNKWDSSYLTLAQFNGLFSMVIQPKQLNTSPNSPLPPSQLSIPKVWMNSSNPVPTFRQVLCMAADFNDPATSQSLEILGNCSI